MPTQLPTVTELSQALAAEGLSEPINLQVLLDAAIETIEAWTGYSPLIGEVGESTVTLDPPQGRYLNLPGGMWAVSAVTVNAAPWALSTQYILRLPDAIELISMPVDTPQSISVTGKRGRASDIPASLWEAIMLLAKARAIAPGSIGTFTPTQVKLGEAEVSATATSLTNKATVYERRAMDIASRYARIFY